MNSIVYIPGYGSKKETSKTFNAILENFESNETTVEYFEYDATKPIKSLEDLNTRLKDLIRKNVDITLVAQSNGGFFGQLLSQRNGVCTVLINPSLRPSISLIKHDLTSEQLSEYDTLQSQLLFKTNSWPKLILLSSEDEIVDPNYTKELFSELCGITLMLGETHRLSDKATQTVIESIHAINNSIAF